ncbi:MAG: hypothetical protein QXL16_02400 [Candidatus Micrarchaeaceae archaeon]
MQKKAPDTVTFDWELYPNVAEFLQKIVEEFLKNNAFARELAKRMRDETSTRFIDWVDYSKIGKEYKKEVEKLGFQKIKAETEEGEEAYMHKSTCLFPVVLSNRKGIEIGIKVDNVDDFAQAHGGGFEIEGKPFYKLRKARISKEGEYELYAIERRGTRGFEVKKSGDVQRYTKAISLLFDRKRIFEDDKEGMEYTYRLVEGLCKEIDSARVSDAFFRAERAYWQKRNRAGQVQKERQDSLGLGWGNHDHHTFRSSRENFKKLIKIFETMGYRCRERYYAGTKAGWGAQILEHEECEIVIFTDVDMFPHEPLRDFAHEGLEPREKLGTVGLWVALHGESILQAGMHHLEGRFDFEKLRQDLPNYKIEFMEPFSYFPFLKQAFTVGETWKVDRNRLEKLYAGKMIGYEEYERFKEHGAIGSHMENLQRDQGFKGFNKASVTKIIRETNPRLEQYGGA